MPARILSKAPPRWRDLFLFLITATLFFFSPKPVFAQVVINEFAAITDGTMEDPDWVELYSFGDQSVNLEGWLLRDSTESNKKELNGFICPKSFRRFDFSNYLNKGGDIIRLFNQDGDLINKIEYFSDSIPQHTKGRSTGRDPDGGLTWRVFDKPTPTDTSCQPSSTLAPTEASSPTDTPTPTSTPTDTPVPTNLPTPTSTPTPQTGVYKINEVKNEAGEILSNVKIYVDGVYIHHYAPEELIFCNNCKCDTYVDCGFGEHTISLQKSAYQDWSETRTITAGIFYEIDPVMMLLAPTSMPTSALVSPTAIPTTLPSITDLILEEATKEEKTPVSFLQGFILGEEDINGGRLIPSRKQSTPSGVKKIRGVKRLPKFFLVLGTLSMFIMVGSAFWIEKRKKFL